jgi:tRNA G18 (ribose-2'-O)-methylase SpoU
MTRGFFAIGVYHPKTEQNIGTLMRSAYLYDAAYVFTIGRRYKRQASDTPNATLHIPMFHYDTFEDFTRGGFPGGAPLIGVELDERSESLVEFGHPERAIYLLGAEDNGLPQRVIDACHSIVQIPTPQPQSMNVATAGAVILHDRYAKSLVKQGVSS